VAHRSNHSSVQILVLYREYDTIHSTFEKCVRPSKARDGLVVRIIVTIMD